MTKFRNLLIAFGVFWFSFWTVLLFDRPFLKLHMTYGDGVLSAVAMGVMDSLGRTLAAIFAGVLVTLVVESRKPERWSLVVAVLYVADSRIHYFWHLPPTWWDRISEIVNLGFPGLACVAAAVVTAKIRKRPRSLMQ